MDDLMEIDFTKKDDATPTDTADQMETEYSPGFDVTPTSTTAPPANTFRTPANVSRTNQTARQSQPMPIARRDPADTDGYMSMKPVGSSDSKQSQSIVTSPRSHPNASPSNLSTSPTKPTTATTQRATLQAMRSTQSINGSSVDVTDDYMMSPVNTRSFSRVPSQNTSYQAPAPATNSSTPDGYMEMSFANRSQTNNNNNNNNSMTQSLERQRQSSSSSISSSNEYINMNFSSIPRTSSASSDCSSTSSLDPPSSSITPFDYRNSRLRSNPITIVGKKSPPSQHTAKQTMGNQPSSNMHAYVSAKAPTPGHLHLNTTTTGTVPSNLPQQMDATNDASVTTPNTSIIFPFSPNSPSGGSNRSNLSSQQQQQSQQPSVDQRNRVNGLTPLDTLSSDYADMTLGSVKNSSTMRATGPVLSPKENIKKLKSSFFAGSSTSEQRPHTNDVHRLPLHDNRWNQSNGPTQNRMNAAENSDYAIMNPIIAKSILATEPAPSSHQQQSTQVNRPLFGTTMGATKKTALVTSNNNPDKVLANTQVKTSFDGFKPITSKADEEAGHPKSGTTTPTTSTAFNRQHSMPVDKHRKPSADNGAYEMLELRASTSTQSMNAGRLTRPSSVNSEKTTFAQLMRPNSANSERQSNSTFSLASTPLNESVTSVGSSSHCSSGTITRPQSSSFLSSGSECGQSRSSSVISVIEQTSQTNSNMMTSRPPSVSSERELHYASLGKLSTT